jgi:hypothetical protein
LENGQRLRPSKKDINQGSTERVDNNWITYQYVLNDILNEETQEQEVHVSV